MIYLDNNATTPIDGSVFEAMTPWLTDRYGNPSAGYRLGKAAKKAIEKAREQVAALIDAHPEEIVFTSCGTESNNTIIRSLLDLQPDRRSILTSTVEHSAVYEVVQACVANGYEWLENPVSQEGLPDMTAWEESIKEGSPAIASLILANNETGVISPVGSAAEIASEHNIFFHTDAVQAVGKIPLSVRDYPIQSLSMSAHKIYGPKGTGALFVDRNSRFRPLILGGGQEDGRRSGTENVAGIVGFGVAAELAAQRLAEAEAVSKLRDDFESAVLAAVEQSEVNGKGAERLPNTSNIYFQGVDGEGLLILLDEAGLCCSPGSACSTGEVKPSRVIKAMGYSSDRARSSVRFSFSRNNTSEDVKGAVEAVKTAVGKLRVTIPTGGGVVINS